VTEARLLPEDAIYGWLRRPAHLRIWKQVADRHSERVGKIPDDVHWGTLPSDFEIDYGGSTETYQVAQGLGRETRFFPGCPNPSPKLSAQAANRNVAEHDAIYGTGSV